MSGLRAVYRILAKHSNFKEIRRVAAAEIRRVTSNVLAHIHYESKVDIQIQLLM